MKTLRTITLIIPITAWLIHIFIIVPLLSMESGERQFILAINFFIIAGTAMIICLLTSIVLLFKNWTSRNAVPILLNLSWLYYVKVILFGPTIGYL
jgi:hypothetical protein